MFFCRALTFRFPDSLRAGDLFLQWAFLDPRVVWALKVGATEGMLAEIR